MNQERSGEEEEVKTIIIKSTEYARTVRYERLSMNTRILISSLVLWMTCTTQIHVVGINARTHAPTHSRLQTHTHRQYIKTHAHNTPNNNQSDWHDSEWKRWNLMNNDIYPQKSIEWWTMNISHSNRWAGLKNGMKQKRTWSELELSFGLSNSNLVRLARVGDVTKLGRK